MGHRETAKRFPNPGRGNYIDVPQAPPPNKKAGVYVWAWGYIHLSDTPMALGQRLLGASMIFLNLGCA